MYSELDRRDGARAAFGLDTAKGERGSRNGLLTWVGAAAFALLALAIAWYLLPAREWLSTLHDWVAGLGIQGILVFAAIYVLGAIVLAPEALLTIAAGVAYGFWGLPIVLVAATIGASLVFLIARYRPGQGAATVRKAT